MQTSKLMPLQPSFMCPIQSVIKLVKRVGERGKPCFTPLVIEKGNERSMHIV